MVQHVHFARFGCQSSLRSVWEAADLSFASSENEAAFCEVLQKQSLFLSSIAGLTHATLQLAIITVLLLFEEASFSDEDAQDGVYAVHFLLLPGIAAAFVAMISIGSLVKEITRSSCLLVEPLWAFAIAVNIIVGFLQSRQGRSWLGVRTLPGCMFDWADLDISAVLLTAFVSISCHLLPLRCCYLWPLVVMAIVSFLIQAFGIGCQISQSQGFSFAPRLLNVVMMCFLLGTSYSAAYQMEKKQREEWVQKSTQEQIGREALARKELAEIALSRDLKVFRVYGCCLVFSLCQDLRISSSSSRTALTLFGTSVTGTSFLSLVAEGDREEFSALCKRVDRSRIPRSMGMKLAVQDGLTPVHVLVVHHGWKSKEFLVGIRLDTGILEDLKKLHPETDSVVPTPSGPSIKAEPSDAAEKGLSTEANLQTVRSYSGFGSQGSSASLCFSASHDESSGFSKMIGGQDQRTQTDACLGQVDQCVETEVPWKDVCFKCRCSNRPQEQVLSEAGRAAIACRQFRPRRHKRNRTSSSLESMSGTWVLEAQFIGIAQSFMHRLTFVGDRCIDARGTKWKVTQEGNSLYLIKGRIWTSGGVLFREGKSGIVMRFQQEEEEEEVATDPFEFIEDPDMRCDEEEQDGLQILENILADGYGNGLAFED